jgi:transposase
MTPAPNFQGLSTSEKDALIAPILARLEALTARVTALEAENAELRIENAALHEKLKLPPKTPRNSSKPPSQGHKPNGDGKAKPKSKVHAGAHRPLHPDPTRRRDLLAERCGHCQADVSGSARKRSTPTAASKFPRSCRT